MKKLIIAGANGFLGRHITRHFHANGWEVVGLARREQGLDSNCRFVLWDGKTMGAWSAELNGATALINLAGRSINCRHNKKNRRQIMESRVDSTTILGEAVSLCSHPPEVWLNASTASVYADAEKSPQGEGMKLGQGFFVDVAKGWEGAMMTAKVSEDVRRIALRTSLVMANEKGTVYDYLLKLSKLFLGGAVGGGKQMVSWVHVEDYCRAVEWLVDHDDIRGVVNVTAPDPLTNADMMKRFQKLAMRPFGLPATSWMARIGALVLRTEPELILKSNWVVPRRLLQNGFVFRHPEMNPSEW
ncbi:MAG: TIGR01777 family oxidoreductase [Akkermansiaceae bacterium]|nr:TIGR01777 family oxidoreductase [Akkermansiaceae bacterium]